MNETKVPNSVLNGNAEGKRCNGRPKGRWLDGVKSDLCTLGKRDKWRGLGEERRERRKLVEEAKIYPGLEPKKKEENK